MVMVEWLFGLGLIKGYGVVDWFKCLLFLVWLNYVVLDVELFIELCVVILWVLVE